ncbi:MAG: hypothetical protein WCK01_00185 [Candidatus Uhrbacteria bacterium]
MLVEQARRLYEKGFAGDLSFDEYVASIPMIPDFPESYTARFPELLLVDARLSVQRQCELLGVDFSNESHSYVNADFYRAKTSKVYWIRAQDGRVYKGKSAIACRTAFAEDEVGLSVHEGLALFAQNGDKLQGRGMDLPASVRPEACEYVVFLSWFLARPLLSWSWGGYAVPHCGSASRGK